VSVVIRDALLSEVDFLTELQRRASLVWEEYREDLLAHPEAVEVPASLVRDGAVRVAIAGGVVVGFSAVVPAGADAVELDGLFVEPDLMRGGVGRALVSDVVARASAAGVSRVEVTANPRALGFYQKVGFVTVGPGETQFGPAIRMYLAVSPEI
jgi:N-acetylglutamate synthase-like GNAT family acetyltransferase